MRKEQKNQIMEIIQTVRQAHEQLRTQISQGELEAALSLLGDCQATAIQMGEIVERDQGEDSPVVRALEHYCEALYQACVQAQEGGQGKSIVKQLNKQLLQVENRVKYHLSTRLEVVFLPYKASMWDALESIWRAADADPDCDAYVVPIPYYDRNPDGSLGKLHYEGGMYPKDVPVVSYQSYDLTKRRPDVVYIHNPYDHANIVTSVDPAYYSYTIKPHTGCLVYVPYYVTTGGMSEGQRSCSAYYSADYIVIQSPYYRSYFDLVLPEKKFLPLGSPKLDRVVTLCQSPPAPPEHWREKMEGRRVYFYNTSISGMLENTQGFLAKMEYVFSCVAKRPEICLIWRPHPLLESTFASMRPQYQREYLALKQRFLQQGLGIYDDTPDIERTISLCQGYIGDAGTSVTTLFGIVGKPLFILNNRISRPPLAKDWSGALIRGFVIYGDMRYVVAQGNQIYFAPEGTHRYCHLGTLPNTQGESAYGSYACTVGNRTFFCPVLAQELTYLEDGMMHTIPFQREDGVDTAMRGIIPCGNSLWILPNQYPALIRYDLETGKLTYLRNHLDFYMQKVGQDWRSGGVCVLGDSLYISSPVDNQILEINGRTGVQTVYTLPVEGLEGAFSLYALEDELWIFPYSGTKVYVWAPVDNRFSQYNFTLPGLSGYDPWKQRNCMERMFYGAYTQGEETYLFSCWANSNIRINRTTGQVEAYRFPFSSPSGDGGYALPTPNFLFMGEVGAGVVRIYCYQEAAFYDLSLERGTFQRVKLEFEPEDLKAHERGFAPQGPWLRYACMETVVNHLGAFLDGQTWGAPFCQEDEIAAYREISTNSDGTCGASVHQAIKDRQKS